MSRTTGSIGTNQLMASSYWHLLRAFVVLLISLVGVDAFLQPRIVLPGTRANNPIMNDIIMSASVERRAFATQLSQGVLCILGLGAGAERVAAYENEYLKEPTAEFKAMEAKQSEFAAAQRSYKKDFAKQLDAFLAVKTDDDAVATLNTISRTVMQRGGLPESIRINDVLKTCRRKKAEMKESGKWGTPVQMAYETLVQITNKTVIPLQSGS